MPRLTLRRLRDLIRNLQYSVSIHAAEELDDDRLTILDLESILLSGEIVARQRNRATGERKSIVRGRTLDGGEGECVVKLGPTGRAIVITIYRD